MTSPGMIEVTIRINGTNRTLGQCMPGLHRLPGTEPDRDTVLEPGELITAVELPPAPRGEHVRRRG
jgi:xanthine dehydrogenase YagS FAD-binding subunit